MGEKVLGFLARVTVDDDELDNWEVCKVSQIEPNRAKCANGIGDS